MKDFFNKKAWVKIFSHVKNKKLLTMFLLGFSAGLPLLLVFTTLSAWLRDENIVRSTIGFFGLVTIFYGLKFLWAPLIDRIRSLDNEIIRQDTLIKTILGVPQLIDSNKIAKADRDDQRKD